MARFAPAGIGSCLRLLSRLVWSISSRHITLPFELIVVTAKAVHRKKLSIQTGGREDLADGSSPALSTQSSRWRKWRCQGTRQVNLSREPRASSSSACRRFDPSADDVGGDRLVAPLLDEGCVSPERIRVSRPRENRLQCAPLMPICNALLPEILGVFRFLTPSGPSSSWISLKLTKPAARCRGGNS